MFFFLIACAADPLDSAQPFKGDDLDGDGWSTGAGDCDDGDAAVYPGATERWYDGVDDDCDGNDDDQDGDGTGLSGGDCNDLDPLVFPGAAERCDSVDNDCDGATDEDISGGVTAYTDVDGDGFGDDRTARSECELPVGSVEQGGDCDDADAAVNPDAAEVCDTLDNDCDGDVDENSTGIWYLDADGDGYGDEAEKLVDCAGGEGYVAEAGDCDDADATVNPGVAETCDDVDRNCDGDTTLGAVDVGAWYPDLDGDTYGDDAGVTVGCVQPEGTIWDGGDCDDSDATVSPVGVEVCDGVDNDCDGTVDVGATDARPLFTDSDGDGYGAGDAGTGCEAGVGTSFVDGDCDDTLATTFPGAAEACDGVDGDCDGAADDPSLTGIAWEDVDGDGYGNGDVELSWTCVIPVGAVDNGDDCDDGDASIAPGAAETCDGNDNDCDDAIDEDGSDTPFYTDADGDGFGDPTTADTACEPAPDAIADGSDCDDGDPAVHPAADEHCDGADEDCDGEVDESPVDGTRFYPDADGDGYGSDADAYSACEGSDLTTGGDCDDTTARTYPGATEVCDHQDNNCSGGTDDEAGAGQLDGDTFTDHTEAFSTGTSTDPFVVGDQSTYDLVVTDTTIHLCAGTWYMKVVTATAGTILRVVGSGPDETTLTTAGTTSGTLGSIVAASNSTIEVSDVTLTGGVGSSGTKGGAVVASQTTGTTTPSTPNITLTGVVVSGNATSYGGAIAINNYGWVSLVDTLVMDNDASVSGGGVWVQDTGMLSCAATALGAGGVFANTAPEGGGVWFDSATHGSLTSVGCDWGEGTEDNAGYDIEVKSGAGTCYLDATDLAEEVVCSGGSCSASTDSVCP